MPGSLLRNLRDYYSFCNKKAGIDYEGFGLISTSVIRVSRLAVYGSVMDILHRLSGALYDKSDWLDEALGTESIHFLTIKRILPQFT